MVHRRTGRDVRIDERREYLRHAETSRVLLLEVGATEKPHAGNLRDLSAGGVGLTTDREVRVGTRVWLGIFFAHMPDGPLIILARVQRCSPEEGSFAVGLEFLRSTRAQRDALGRVRQYLIEQHGG
jgi:hypothetical protein